jgi:hypothetical protein
MKIGDTYYYDNGSQVPLEPADEVAVDLHSADAADVPRAVLGSLKKHGHQLRSGVVMLGRDEVAGDVVDALDQAGALHPVFRAEDGALLVVLPEIRLEAADKTEATKIRRWLESADVDSEVVRDAGERLVVRPTSGRGVDALDLANRIVEEVQPRLAQARFLRIVPRPESERTSRSGSK